MTSPYQYYRPQLSRDYRARPETRVYPDDRTAWLHLRYQRAQAQALSRNEPWAITYDEWVQAWGPHVDSTGRHSTDYCLMRRDNTLPWQLDNIWAAQRHHQLRYNCYRKWLERNLIRYDPDRLFEITRTDTNKEAVRAHCAV